MKNRNPKRRVFILVFVVILITLLFLLNIFLFRIFLPRQIDDLHPLIGCDDLYLEKSDLIMVIPLYKNVSIASYPEWCKKIKDINKTIGMHGVYHTFNEFKEKREGEYIERGIKEFEKCFGFRPAIFEAPQWELSKENEVLLKQMGFEIKNKANAFTHKIYHCSDGGEYSYRFLGIKVTNKRIDFI